MSKEIKNNKSSGKIKKTIVIATDNFYPRIDGIAVFLNNLIPYLLNDFNIHIIAPNFIEKKSKNIKDKIEDEIKYDYNITRIPLTKMKYGDYRIPQKPKGVNDIIAKADLVFIQTIGTIGKEVAEIADSFDKPLFAFIHSIERILAKKSLSSYNPLSFVASSIARNYANKIYNKCDGIIVPSASVGHILSRDGINSQKYVVHLGIDYNKFKPLSNEVRKKELKTYLGFREDDYVLGYVGRIAREKSLPTLFEAFKRLEIKNKKLLIIGEGIDTIKNKAKEQLGDDVLFVGNKIDVVPYLQAMDTFVMPSLIETTCLAALEAMSCGIPVIATKVGSIPEYLFDKKNGMLFPKKNSTILRLKIQQLHKDKLKRRDISKSARKTIETNFNFEISAKKIRKIFKDTLGISK